MLQHCLRTALLLGVGGWLGSGCAGVKPYEKEYLLNPLMDDKALQSLTSDFPGACASSFERLSMSGVGSSNSTSCPTCGG